MSVFSSYVITVLDIFLNGSGVFGAYVMLRPDLFLKYIL